MLQRSKFSLRTLMLAVTLCAFLPLIWKLRPSVELSVTLNTNGTALINGEVIQSAELLSRLGSELWWRSIWRMEPTMHLSADSTVTSLEYVEFITETHRLGVKKFRTVAARENGE